MKFIGIGLAIIIAVFILSLLELYTQVSRYSLYWEKNNQESAAPDEILYVALGDSTAQGIGATSPKKGYVSLIARQIEEDRGQPVKTVNLSKSGAKVKDALNTQLPALKKQNVNDKTILTIEIGANDMINFDNKDFEKDMDNLMGQLPKQTVISDIPYFGGTRFKSRQPNVDKANEIMYKLAQKHGFKLVPLHDKIKQNSGPTTFAADWFHPSNKAYRENWAPVFLEPLQ